MRRNNGSWKRRWLDDINVLIKHAVRINEFHGREIDLSKIVKQIPYYLIFVLTNIVSHNFSMLMKNALFLYFLYIYKFLQMKL